MLAGMQVACLGKFGLHGPAGQTDAAKALVPAERSVMVQPDQDMSLGVGNDYVDLKEANDPAPYLLHLLGIEPKRIELAPGKHRFKYDGGQSWLWCKFEVSMESGHVYKPQALKQKQMFHKTAGSMCRFAEDCMITLSDTAPNGHQTELKLDCLDN